MDCVCGNRAVTLVAELIDVRHIQQPGILRSVRRVAGYTAFCPDSSVLEDERATCFRVALRADRVLIGSDFEIAGLEGSVHIVAVAAAHQALIHLVVEGHRKCWFDGRMALETKVWLRSYQKRRVRHGLMNAVTAKTAHAGLRMRRAQEVRMRVCMATQARLVDLRGRQLVETHNLGDIATAVHVRLACAVAAFARRSCSAVLQRQLGMRIVRHTVCLVLMTGRAGVIANKSICGRCCRALRQSLCLRLRLGKSRAGATCGQNSDHRNQKKIHRDPAGQLPHTVTPLLARSWFCLVLEIGLDLNKPNHSRDVAQDL